MKRKLLSLLLVFVMFVSLFPVGVFADEGNEPVAEEPAAEEPAAEEPVVEEPVVEEPVAEEPAAEEPAAEEPVVEEEIEAGEQTIAQYAAAMSDAARLSLPEGAGAELEGMTVTLPLNYADSTVEVLLAGLGTYGFYSVGGAVAAVPEGGKISLAVPVDTGEITVGWFTAQADEQAAAEETVTLNIERADVVAKIGAVEYGSVASAVADAEAGAVIVLQHETTEAGFVTEAGKSVTLDLGGYTYTVNGPVGSPGTVTNGLQLIKGSTVTIRNGTLAAAADVTIRFLIKNYADLTLENVVMPGENINDNVISNCGQLTVNGENTSIGKPSGGVWAVTTGNYAHGDVITTAVNAGTIYSIANELVLWSTGGATVDESVTTTINGGYIGAVGKYDWRPEYNGEYDNEPELTNEKIIITGGLFGSDPAEYVTQPALTKAVEGAYPYAVYAGPFKVGGKGYPTVAEAVAAATDGAVIELLSDVTAAGLVTEAGKNITLDLKGYSYTVNGPVGSPGTVTNGMQLKKGSTVTIRNGVLYAADDVTIKFMIKNYANLTLENVTIPGENISENVISNCGQLTVNGENTGIGKPSGGVWAVTTGNYAHGDVITTTVNAGTIYSIANELVLWSTGGATVDESVTTYIKGGNIGTVGKYDWRPEYAPDYDNEPELANEKIIVTGGCFGNDPTEYLDTVSCTVEEVEGDAYPYKIVPGAFRMGDNNYTTAQAAVDAAAAGATIVLQRDSVSAGFVTEAGKSVTLDLGGHSYTVNGPVGSAGTVTNGMQLIKGSTVTIRNGTLAAAADVTIRFLIKNYADLTLENVVMPGENINDNVISNCGQLTVNGENTSIGKPSGGVWAVTTGNYAHGDVITTTVNAGTIDSIANELVLWSTGGAMVDESVTTTINGGNIGTVGKYDWRPEYNGEYDDEPELTNEKIIVTGGRFGNDPSLYVVPSKSVEPVTGGYLVREGAFKVGGNVYGTAGAAIAAVGAGGTVELQCNVIGEGFVVNAGKSFTLDLGGYTYTINKCFGSAGTETNGTQLAKGSTVAIRNGELAAGTVVSGKPVKFMIKNYADLTLENVKIPGENISQNVVSNCGQLTVKGDGSSISRPEGGVWAITTGNYAHGDIITTTIEDGLIDSIANEIVLWTTGGATVDESVTTYINGGYIGTVGKYDWRPEYAPGYDNEPELANEQIIITGGCFISNPMKYLAASYGVAYDSEAIYKYSIRLLGNVIKVQELIDALPAAAEVRLSDESIILAAREAYDALGADTASIDDAKLVAAENALDGIESFVDSHSISVASKYIIRVGDTITAAWVEADTASEAYSLTWSIPATVTAVTAEGAVLTAAALEEEEDSAEAVVTVECAKLGISKTVAITVLPAEVPEIDKVVLVSANTVAVNALSTDNDREFTVLFGLEDGTTVETLPEGYTAEVSFKNAKGAELLDAVSIDGNVITVSVPATQRAATLSGMLNVKVTKPGQGEERVTVAEAALSAVVKVTAVKPNVKFSAVPTLNTFYNQASGALSFTSTSGAVTNVTLPEEADFEYDFGNAILAVKAGKSPAARTALVFTVTVEGYQPLAVTVNALTRVTAPKAKLASSAISIKAFQDGDEEPKAVDMQVVPSVRNADYAALEVTGIAVAAEVNATTYPEQAKYSVSEFNAEDGSFKLTCSEALARASGKVLLSVSFSNGAKTLDLPVTVSVKSVVTAKLAKSALTLGKTTLTGSEWDTAETNVVMTPASEAAVLDVDRPAVITPATDALGVSVTDGVLTVQQVEGETLAKGSYRVSLYFVDVVRPVVLSVRCTETQVAARLSKSALTLSKTALSDWNTAEANVTMTPVGTEAALNSFTVSPEVDTIGVSVAEGVLTVRQAEGKTLAAGTYRITLNFDGAKPVTLSLRCAETPVTAKLTKSSLALRYNLVGGDSAVTDVRLTPAYLQSELAFDTAEGHPLGYTVTTGRNVDASDKLDVALGEGTLTVSANANTVNGSYKVTLYFDGVAKPLTLTVSCSTPTVTARLAKSALNFNLNWPSEALAQDIRVTMSPVSETAVLDWDNSTVTTVINRATVDAKDKFAAELNEGVLSISALDPENTAVGSYKFTLDLGATRPVVLTVKCATPAVTARLGKSALSVNAAMGAGVDSAYTTLKLSDAAINSQLTQSGVTVKLVNGRTERELTELDWSFNNGIFTVYTNDTEYGARDVSYKLAIYAEGAVDAKGVQKPVYVTVKVAVKKAVLTSAVKGKLDLVNAGSQMTAALKLTGITAPIADFVSTGNVELRDANGEPHSMIEIKRVENGVAYIGWTLEGRALAKAEAVANRNRVKAISYNVVVTIAGVEYSLARNASVTPGMTMGKTVASPTAVTLFKSAPYETAEFSLTNTVGSIESVTLTGAGFKLYDHGNGSYSVGFESPAAAAAQARKTSASVRLNVMLEGSIKPVALTLRIILK